jgi:adenylate cyclase
MPQLIIEQPGIAPMTMPVADGEILLGRSDDCDIVLVADEVSRQHARIVRRGPQTLVQDQKSLNGVYVNRQRIVERVLSHLDEIWLGSKCRIVFRDDTAMGRAAEAGAAVEKPATDQRLSRHMDEIRAEMERVGNSMTLIGRPSPLSPAAASGTIQDTVDVAKMGKAYRRLAALHKASMVMASHFDLRERLSQTLDTIMAVMEADRGFVLLREPDSEKLNVMVAREMGKELSASSPSLGVAGRAAIDGEPVLMSDQATDQEFGMRESIIMSKILCAMAVPLKVNDRLFGSIYVDARKLGVAFSEEDLELFTALAAQASMAIDHVRLHNQVVEAEKKRQEFGRFLSPSIVDRIMAEDATIELGGQRAVATTLFCDIRGFSTITEKITPQELVDMLNEYFTAMTEIIFEHQGTVNKYVGDEIMAVFGTPLHDEDAAFHAVRTAIGIQHRNAELNIVRAQEGRATFELGIGIDTGEVSAGYIGSPMRMEFTVVGDRVNTASRFCGIAGGGQIVIGQGTWEAAQDRIECKPIGTVMLKGKEQPVHAYEVVRLLG